MSEGKDLKRRGHIVLKPCTRKLVGFLSNESSKLRGAGAKALGKIKDPETVVTLIDALLKKDLPIIVCRQKTNNLILI